MTRSFWLKQGVATAAALSVAWLSSAITVGRQLDYPCPTKCCKPNVQGWGHFETQWRTWPGDACRPERINPLSVGKERLPTPQGTEEVPLPPTVAPTTPMPPTRAPETEPVPLPTPGSIVPPSGLNLPATPGPGEEKPSAEPSEGLQLPELPSEPEPKRPAPPPATEPAPPRTEKAPARSNHSPSPKDRATTRPPAPVMRPVWHEDRQPATTATPPAAKRAAPEAVVAPAGGLEPERNMAVPPVYRADSIEPVAPTRRLTQVEPAAYAVAEPSTRSLLGRDQGPASQAAPNMVRAAVQEQPVGPAADAAAPAVALGGYCPVELNHNGRWVKGDLRWTVVHNGHIYRLSGAQQRQDFLANPESFTPAFGGSDPVLWIDEHRMVAGQQTYCATYAGRLYMFSSEATQLRFNSSPQRYAAGR
ncbi:MAG: hypothetical protein ABFC96_11890 [Thermoguttaceae bacterium]